MIAAAPSEPGGGIIPGGHRMGPTWGAAAVVLGMCAWGCVPWGTTLGGGAGGADEKGAAAGAGTTAR